MYNNQTQRSGFSNARPHRQYVPASQPVRVVYTHSELKDVKYSRSDVVATVFRLAKDQGLELSAAKIHNYGGSKELVFTTAQLNDEVANLLG